MRILRGAAVVAILISCCAWVDAQEIDATVGSAAAVENSEANTATKVDEDSQPVESLLPGFTSERLQVARQVAQGRPSVIATEEAARLVWNLRRIGSEALRNSSSPLINTQPINTQPSDGATSDTQSLTQPRLITGQGRATRVDAIVVPNDLAEMLEVERVFRVTVETLAETPAETPAGSTVLIVSSVPKAWLRHPEIDEPIEFTGVEVASRENADEVRVVFAPGLRWVPDQASGDRWPRGWQLLGEAGFDVSFLGDLNERARKPLLAEDEEAFYGMLEVAAEVFETRQIAGDGVATMDLLQSPEELVGEWVSVRLEIARVTRVRVEEVRDAAMLGADQYWQIDCFGNLDGARVELQGEDGSARPLVFENRFPVSVVARELPEWLEQSVVAGAEGGGEVDTRMVRHAVVVTGFYYRLWSYRSEFTERRGGRQVAPLIVAGQITADALAEPSGYGADLFGWIMAAGVVAVLVVVGYVLVRSGREDKKIRARRRGLST